MVVKETKAKMNGSRKRKVIILSFQGDTHRSDTQKKGLRTLCSSRRLAFLVAIAQ